MNRSFFAVRKDAALAAGSDNFSTKISASATTYGLTAAQATAYAAVNATWQSAYQTALTPDTRTKSAVAAKNAARAAMRQMASDLAKIIDGTPTVSDSQRIDLGLAVRPTPAPRPAPGTPNRFTVALAEDGALTLKWKCNNHRGASGTMYQVWRRVGATAPFEYLGGSGTKAFVDATIPAGTPQVTYQIQAVRSTAVGAWAQYTVSFGTPAGGAPVGAEETPEPAPLRPAA
jgi:hypothetical protein